METAEIVVSLNTLLANYQVFYNKLRNFHWNIEGPEFFELHEEFENEYNTVKENIDIEEDLSNLQEIIIYELPKPLLPEKNTRRREQGGATTSGFNTLEIDPETGKPILEKKEEE